MGRPGIRVGATESGTHRWCLVVIMYESEDLGELTPVVWDNLYGALASWYAAVIPEGRG